MAVSATSLLIEEAEHVPLLSTQVRRNEEQQGRAFDDCFDRKKR